MKLDNAISAWQLPDLPAGLGVDLQDAGIGSISLLFERRLADETVDRSAAQLAIADWLYYLVRANVKRGRAFELDEVLATGRADCLGYARLLAALGGRFGVELGIVEVLIDIIGRYVPHHVSLLTPDNGSRRFLDPWYGSASIRHWRYGALVNGKPADINDEEIEDIEELKGLPERCIEGIELYIRGNRLLQKGDIEGAIRLYSEAIMLYPANTRACYNRALAHDRKGEVEAAHLDYETAFENESGVIRVLARIDDLESLIALDDGGVSEEKQDIYLRHRGYKTGKPVSVDELGRHYGLSPASVEQIIGEVEGCVSAG